MELGGIEETTELLAQRWDFIVFTGSPHIGKIIALSENNALTPKLLELGGKSPCIMHDDADITIAARRIAWGKFLNAGQTCIAPDYIVAHKNVAKKLTEELTRQIEYFYGKNPKISPDYCRIINKKQYDRLCSLINGGNIFYGGDTDPESMYIGPTLFSNVEWDDKLMKDEIFGPLLPIIEYSDIDDVVGKILSRERPLAVYIFTKSKKLQNKIIEGIPFGGGCINTTLMHSASTRLPFGGTGNSGMGRYHGKHGFNTFSYLKAIVTKPTSIDFKFIYPPYGKKLSLLKKI